MEFIGNEKIVAMLQATLGHGRAAHAYLFSGPERVGKFHLAHMFARSVIAGKDHFDDASSESGTYAMDMIVIKPPVEEKKGVRKKKLISVEQIRQARADLNLYPYGGVRRVLLIDDADMLSISAQNSLLKTLEEPARTAMLILVASDAGKILPTLRSRVQQLSFSLASDDALSGMVAGGDASRRNELCLYAMGRPGLLYDLLKNNDLLERSREFSRLLLRVRKGNLGERLRIAEELAKDTISLIEILSLWLWISRGQAHSDTMERREAEYAMIGMMQECIETLKMTNANARITLESLFIALQ